MLILTELLLLATPFPSLERPLLQGQETKAPVPSDADQKEALKLVRDLFKDEFGKRTKADRLALSKKLQEQASQSKDDPVSRFVLLREARDLAAEAADADEAMRLTNDLFSSYAIDLGTSSDAALSTVSKNAKTQAEVKALAAAYSKLAESLIDHDDFDAAEKAFSQTLSAAKRAQDVPLVTSTISRQKDVKDFKARFEKVRKAQEILKTDPENAAANLTVGQFRCLIKGDWEAGLPLLAKGSDAALKAFAEANLANPNEAAAQARVGDSCWDLAEKESGAAKRNLRDRSLFWYRKSLAELTGLAKAKTEKRVTELLEETVFRGTWVDLEPISFGMKGLKTDPVILNTPPGTAKNVDIQKMPPGDFDGISGRLSLPSGRAAFGMIQHTQDSWGVVLSARDNKAKIAHSNRPGWVYEAEHVCLQKTEYTITVLIREGFYTAFVDGVEVMKIPEKGQKITVVSLYVDGGPVHFDRMRLRKRD